MTKMEIEPFVGGLHNMGTVNMVTITHGVCNQVKFVCHMTADEEKFLRAFAAIFLNSAIEELVSKGITQGRFNGRS